MVLMESVCLDHDVEVDGSCGRDVAGTTDARVVQQMVFSMLMTIDGLFCPDVDVKHVELDDVRTRWMTLMNLSTCDL